MIVAMQDKATDEQIQHVIERMVELGFNVHRTTGEFQTILAGVGTPSHFEVTEFQVLPGVHQAYRISSPYKLAGRGLHFRTAWWLVAMRSSSWPDRARLRAATRFA